MNQITTSVDIDDALNDKNHKIKSLLADLMRSVKNFFNPKHRYLFKVIPTYDVPHGHMMEELLTAISLDYIEKRKIRDEESEQVFQQVYEWFNLKKPELEDDIEQLLIKWKKANVTDQEMINKEIERLNEELQAKTTIILSLIILNRDKFYL